MSVTKKDNIINRELPHVNEDFLERFSHHEVAKISDGFAKYGTLRPEIKTLSLGKHLSGQAVTVKCCPGDFEAIEAAAEVMQPGNVLVIAGNEEDNIAFAGRYIAALLVKKQAGGLVVDGAIRDREALIASGLPIYARETTAVKHAHKGRYEVNVPVNCGGLVINPGDIIVGDDDGLIAVPYYDAERALALADDKVAGEERLQKVIDQRNITFTELAKCEAKINVWREDPEK